MLRIKTFWRGLTTIGRVVIIAAVLLFVVAVVSSYFSGQRAKTEARLSENQTEAALESGQDAVGTVGAQNAREDTIDATTKDNTNAIRNAEGADTPVPPAVDAVARERLCKRLIYRDSTACKELIK